MTKVAKLGLSGYNEDAYAKLSQNSRDHWEFI